MIRTHGLYLGKDTESGERLHWEKEEGRLVYLERNLVQDDPTDLTELLADTPIHATYRVEDGVAELALYPETSSRATRRERREVERALDAWSELLGTYFDALENLYRYLELRPDRALACFGNLFESDDSYGELTVDEEALLETLGESTAGLLEVLDVDEERAYSLDELSRRVFDPFPARFEIELPAPAIEVEGFLAAGERFAVPGLSLWSALEVLEGAWITPDPLLAWVDHERASTGEDFDVAAFAARSRSAQSVADLEVRDAVIDALSPEDVYRVTWRVEP